MIKDYDIAIIGAGAAGLTVASVASQLGHSVVLIEGHKMGGDCLNYGCIPSKAFLSISRKTKSFTKTFKHIHDSIKFIEPHDSKERFEGMGVDIIKGYARFLDKNTLFVNNNEIIAKKIVIATGSKPLIPKISGLDKIEYLTNESIFNLTDKPKSIMILGAGPIGVEMATSFNNLGVKTTIIQRSTGILKHDDQELADMLKNRLLREGIEIFEDTSLHGVSKKGSEIDFHLESGGDEFVLSAEKFLIATGRTPNTENLDLYNAGIDYDKNGYINVSASLQTSNKSVYALGDITGFGLFTHLAGYQASIFIKKVLFGSIFTKANYKGLPWTTYTPLELAQVGLTEEQAKSIFNNKIKVITVDFKENDRAVCEDEKYGKAKLILNKKGQALGVSIFGKNAGEIIQQWSQVVQEREKPSKLLNQIYTYPTYSDINRLLASKVYQEKLYSKPTGFISRLLFKYIGSKI